MLEGISELPPEQAVVKLQRLNTRLRRKAEAALALEQENTNLKTQLQDLANQMASPCCSLTHAQPKSSLRLLCNSDLRDKL